MRSTVFDLGGDKALGPDGFLIAFSQHFCDITKVDIIDFFREFHQKGKISNNIGASFIALIPKNKGAECIKDFRPISLIGSICKILTKVLASRLQKAMSSIIS